MKINFTHHFIYKRVNNVSLPLERSIYNVLNMSWYALTGENSRVSVNFQLRQSNLRFIFIQPKIRG